MTKEFTPTLTQEDKDLIETAFLAMYQQNLERREIMLRSHDWLTTDQTELDDRVKRIDTLRFKLNASARIVE